MPGLLGGRGGWPPRSGWIVRPPIAADRPRMGVLCHGRSPGTMAILGRRAKRSIPAKDREPPCTATLPLHKARLERKIREKCAQYHLNGAPRSPPAPSINPWVTSLSRSRLRNAPVASEPVTSALGAARQTGRRAQATKSVVARPGGYQLTWAG